MIEPTPTYKIIRFWIMGDHRTIRRGLTLDEAQAHCVEHANDESVWFDRYQRETTK